MSLSIRKVLPSLITFSGVVNAFTAIVLAIQGNVVIAGSLIVLGVLIDALDGGLARRLEVTSSFGLQLDSLVDAIAFGITPCVLVYTYLAKLGLNLVLLWAVCTAYIVAGVFRLARFNLLPEKETHSDSLGLSISHSGATLALCILSNHVYADQLFPIIVIPLFMILLTVLMVSQVRFPALASVFKSRWVSIIGLGIAFVVSLWITVPLVWFSLNSAYIAFGLARSIYALIRPTSTI